MDPIAESIITGNLFGIPVYANKFVPDGQFIMVPQNVPDLGTLVARKLSESLARKMEQDLMDLFLSNSFNVNTPAVPITMADVREEWRKLGPPEPPMTRPEPKLI